MGEYGNNFSKIEHRFPDAIKLARNNKYSVKGIIINAFTEPFFVGRELFDYIEGLESALDK